MELASFSPIDMAIIMGFALIVFGPKRLPEVGRQLGGLVKELRKTMSQITDAVEGVGSDVRSVLHDPAPTSSTRYGDNGWRGDSELMKPYDQRDDAPARLEQTLTIAGALDKPDDSAKPVAVAVEPHAEALLVSSAKSAPTAHTGDALAPNQDVPQKDVKR